MLSRILILILIYLLASGYAYLLTFDSLIWIVGANVTVTAATNEVLAAIAMAIATVSANLIAATNY